MQVVTRPVHAGAGRHAYAGHVFHTGTRQVRPATGRLPQVRLSGPSSWPSNMSGPMYQGMDPSDPLTYVRQWNPTPGMVGRLNFDGAQLQGRTPTQLQRGPQQRKPRRLRISP